MEFIQWFASFASQDVEHFVGTVIMITITGEVVVRVLRELLRPLSTSRTKA